MSPPKLEAVYLRHSFSKAPPLAYSPLHVERRDSDVEAPPDDGL
jgi:hypothetical protein